MKILLIGTGALGCFYGAKIARFGGDITFFSRGENFKHIHSKGLIVKSDTEETFHMEVRIIDQFDLKPQYDLVIIATKSYDVRPLVEKLPKSLFQSSHFMTLQNGLASEDILLEKIKPEQLLPVSSFVGLKKVDSNMVHHTGGGRFQFGIYPGGKKEGFVEKLFDLLIRCGIDAHFSENIMKIKWGKLVWNSAYNPLSTITRFTLGDILSCEEGVQLLRESMRETTSVAKKFGFDLDEAFIDKQINLPSNLHSFKTSMLQDFQNGKPLELDAILEDLIKKAKKQDITVPTNNLFYSLVKLLLHHRDQKS